MNNEIYFKNVWTPFLDFAEIWERTCPRQKTVLRLSLKSFDYILKAIVKTFIKNSKKCDRKISELHRKESFK